MEVHHHPHVEKKGFKEYFLEFLMIFLAVTLGFFAENVRENISNHHREKQYMQSMLEDLRQDTAMLQHQFYFSGVLASGLDSLKTMLYAAPGNINTTELYRLQVNYSRFVGLTFNNRTSSQLKTGGMNFIENTKVANAISNYWLREDLLNFIVENISDKIERASELRYEIFNFKYVPDVKIESAGQIDASIDPVNRLLNADPAVLANYDNRLSYIIRVLKYSYKTTVQKQYNAASDLITLIEKEYSLK